MKRFSFIMAAILGLSATLFVTGCFNRPVYIEDHPDYPVTLLDQQKVGKLTGMIYKHRYFVCADAGSALNCKQVCDGDSEYKCPGGFFGGIPWQRFETHHRAGGSAAAAPAAPVMEEPMADETEEEVAE